MIGTMLLKVLKYLYEVYLFALFFVINFSSKARSWRQSPGTGSNLAFYHHMGSGHIQ